MSRCLRSHRTPPMHHEEAKRHFATLPLTPGNGAETAEISPDGAFVSRRAKRATPFCLLSPPSFPRSDGGRPPEGGEKQR
jgi:hypothetical protein